MTPEAKASAIVAELMSNENISSGVLEVRIAQAIRAHARQFETVKETFGLFSDAQRLELVHSCCTECGDMGDGCQCWNDESRPSTHP
jgi:hypothetical protein